MLLVRSDWLTRRRLASTIHLRANRRERFLHFRPLVAHKITFWSANYSACVVYTKTIIHLSVSESDGYFPPLQWIIVNYVEVHQPRSQGPLSTSRKYPGCCWSRVYVYKSNPHRGWIFDLILSTLSMEVKVALQFISWKLSKLCSRDPAWPVLQSFLSKLLWAWDVVCLFSPLFSNNRQQLASD